MTYSKGCDLTSGSSADRDAAVQAAKDADQVVRPPYAATIVAPTNMAAYC